jgi:hypothetical protein
VLTDNPLADFVELPDEYRALRYSNLLPGVIRGGLEMVRLCGCVCPTAAAAAAALVVCCVWYNTCLALFGVGLEVVTAVAVAHRDVSCSCESSEHLSSSGSRKGCCHSTLYAAGSCHLNV